MLLKQQLKLKEEVVDFTEVSLKKRNGSLIFGVPVGVRYLSKRTSIYTTIEMARRMPKRQLT